MSKNNPMDSNQLFSAIAAQDNSIFDTEFLRIKDEKSANNILYGVTITFKETRKNFNLLEFACYCENTYAFNELLKANLSWSSLQLTMIMEVIIEKNNAPMLLALCEKFNCYADALSLVCRYDKSDMFLKLKDNAHFNKQDGRFAVRAAAFGSEKVLKLLIENNFTFRANQDEALLMAARGKHQSCVQLLLNNKADIHARDDFALRTAMVAGDHTLVEFLLKAGANPEALNEEDHLHTANANKDFDLVNLVLTHMAKRNITPSINAKQSTHDPYTQQDISDSILRLQQRYAFTPKNLDKILGLIIGSMRKAATKDPKAKIALDFLLSLMGSSYVDEKSNTSFRALLVLVWQALHDKAVLKLSPAQSLEKYIDILFNNHSPKSDDVCESGQFNFFIEELNGLHPDVRLRFVNKFVAGMKLQVIVREEALKFIRAQQAPSLFFVKPKDVESIWPSIREVVKNRMFQEFSSIFSSIDDQEFNDFIDVGIATNLYDDQNEEVKRPAC